jgi:hypothetical protein
VELEVFTALATNIDQLSRIYAAKPRPSWVSREILHAPQKIYKARRCQVKLLPCSTLVLVSSHDIRSSYAERHSVPLGEYWSQKAVGNSDNKGKQLRRDGFTLAEERYGTLRLCTVDELFLLTDNSFSFV